MTAHRPQPPTIYAPATASGAAAIAIVRVSGPAAKAALRALSGRAPPRPQRASLRVLRHPMSGAMIDEALVLWFAAPLSYSGEDMVEYHIHGGAAVQAALLAAGQIAEDYFFEQAQFLDEQLEAVFAEAGVEVVHMTREQADAWRAIAAETSYSVFADEVPTGAELIEKALAVE